MDKDNYQSSKSNKANMMSLFIKQGKFLTVADKNPYYDFANFEKVKTGGKNIILGSGAFGDVYQIKNKLDGKLFAMKQMEKSRLMSVGIKPEIIYREISIHQKLVHDHIARLHSYHEDKNSFYLILEFVENGTLFSVIQKKKGLSEEDSFKYFIQVASALYFLHEHSLIHRDIKPENCLIDKNGNVKICDFGWTVETNKTRVTFCGTYEYMAPEIIKEMPYNNSIDVWSLGVLLYELLHSYSPFRAKMTKCIQTYENFDPSVEVLKNILKFSFKIEKQVTDDCKDILNKLLNPKTEMRISIVDIFKHPWVKNFEDRIKVKSFFEEHRVINKEIKMPSNDNILINKNPNNKVEDSRSQFNNNIIALNGVKNCDSKVNTDNNETLLIKDSTKTQTDELFNSVLEQVQHGKKKHKRKSLSQNNYRFSIKNIYKSIEEEMKKNKIVLRMEKTEDSAKNDTIGISPIRNFREGYYEEESNFSMFKDIKEIDKEIDKKADEKTRRLGDMKKNADLNKEEIIKNDQRIGKSKKQATLEINNFASSNEKEFNKISNNSNKFFENLQTQPQSMIAGNLSQDSFKEKMHLRQQDLNKKLQHHQKKTMSKNADKLYTANSNYNDEIFFNNNVIRSSNMKYKKNPANNKKNLKQINKDLEFLCSKNPYEISVGDTIDITANSANSDKLPFRYKNKSEMSIQTDSPMPATGWAKFFGFLNSFKCG